MIKQNTHKNVISASTNAIPARVGSHSIFSCILVQRLRGAVSRFVLKSLRILRYVLILCVIPSVSYGRITATASLSSGTVKTISDHVDDKTLVLINIDDTIITPKSKMFRYNNNPYITFMDELYALSLRYNSVNATITQLILQRQMMLVEQSWPDFIKGLKARGALVFGFVKTLEPYRTVENFEEWQYNQLRALNIQFVEQINQIDIFKLDDKDPKAPIFFYKGIVFTGLLSKTQALIKFLDKTQLKPTKIIIIENKKFELERINSFMRTVDIEYIGLEYLAVLEIQGSPEKDIAELQQKTLLNTRKWLEDSEAETILRAQSSESHTH